MNSFNAVGRVGQDAIIRYTTAGDPILGWSIAVSSGYGKNEVTTWVNCSLFGKRAEKLADMIRKGQQIGITGEILLREYESKGSKKQSLECRVNDVTLIGSKSDSNETYTAPDNAQPVPSNFDDFEDAPF